MTPFLRKLLGLNWLIVVNMVALAVFGVIAVYSATYMRSDPVSAEFWRKQATWVGVGLAAFMVTSLIDYRWIRWGALPMYFAAIVFLILTRFIGTKVYGARSWLNLGPINFQPSQLAVVAGIMVLALFLSQFRNMHPMLRLALCGAIVGAPCLLILMQPDLGMTIIWGPVLMALLFVAGIPLRYLLCIILIVVAFIPVAINLGLKPYQKKHHGHISTSNRRSAGAAWAINQVAHRDRLWRLVRQRLQGAEHAGGAWLSPRRPHPTVHNDYIFSANCRADGASSAARRCWGLSRCCCSHVFLSRFVLQSARLLLVVGKCAHLHPQSSRTSA
jgi:rod shape determining protein RodA